MRKRAMFSTVIGLVATALLVAGAPAWAAGEVERANRDAVGLVSGSVTGTYARFAQDLSDALDAPGELRVIAMLGKGSIQNIADLLYLRNVDAAIVQSDVLRFLRDGKVFPGLEEKNSLRYATTRRGSARFGTARNR